MENGAGFDMDRYLARSRALDLDGIAWGEVPRYPLPASALRSLRYMQDIESHTIVYLRALLGTRAIDDPEVATFLACWLYEETFHGLALARFLEAAGERVPARARSEAPFREHAEAMVTSTISRLWPDFCAVHMLWGAINELTTLTGYVRLAKLAGHPVLDQLLERIVRDESRHFFFYYRQAEMRLQQRSVAGVARTLVRRFWAPVGSGVQPRRELEFLARYLFAGPEGVAAIRKVDDTIRRLPGLDGMPLLESWIDEHIREVA